MLYLLKYFNKLINLQLFKMYLIIYKKTYFNNGWMDG